MAELEKLKSAKKPEELGLTPPVLSYCDYYYYSW